MLNLPLIAAGLAGLFVLSMASVLWWRSRRPHPVYKWDLETTIFRLQPAPRPEAPLFSAVEVVKSYRDPSGVEVVALRLEGRPLEIGHGVTAILGPSGVGKSTLLSLLAGLDVPTDGVLRFRGEPLPEGESAAMQAHRGHHVALVFQSLNLITHLSALENAALPLLVRGVSRGEALERARVNLAAVGIGEELLDRLPAQLSGGQQQRVAVARAFTADAEVILADEPTGSLDQETAASVMEVFADRARDTGRPVVLVTHNEDLAARYADRTVRLTAHGYEEVGQYRCLPRRVPARRGAPRGRPRMGWLNRLRYAFSDLRHRRTSTTVTVVAVGIAALYALLVGFSGERMHHVQREALGQALVTRVVAQAAQVTDAAHRFTPKVLAEMEGWPEVRLAFACVEFNAEVALGAGKAEMLPLAATVPNDPAIAPDRLHWGTGVRARDGNEVVLGRRLFERLGGKLVPEPLPAEVDVQIGRQMGGRPEVQRIRARIAGILRNAQEEKVFLPLETAARLNLWREGKLADLGGGRGRASGVEYPFCLAYSPPAQAERAREELEHYNLRGEKVRTLEVTEAAGPIWADVAGAGVPAAAREALRKLANVKTSRVHTAPLGMRTALAPSPDDGRWALLPREATALGKVGTRPGTALPTLAEGYRLPDSFPAKADLVCTLETLGWLSFDPRSPRAERFTLVRTRNLEAGAVLATEADGRVRADVEEGWLFLYPGGGIQPRELEALRRPGAADAETIAEGSVKVPADADSAAVRSVPMRVLPDALFARLVTRRPHRGRIACAYVSPRAGRAPSSLEIRGQRLEVCDERSGREESLWISASDAAAICPDARPAGVAVWGRWDSLLRAWQIAAAAGWSIDLPASQLPSRFAALVRGSADSWRRRLSLAAGEAVEVCGVPDVRQSEGGRRLVAVAAADLGEEGEGVRLGGEPAGRRTLSLRMSETTWERVPAMGDPELPPGLLVVGERLFREIAFRAAGSPLPSTEVHDTIVCDDPLSYAASERLLAAQGAVLEPLTAVRRKTLVEYKVTDGRAPDGKVKPEVVQLLRTLPPAFEAAQAQVGVDALLAGERVNCTGSDAADPRRFGCRLSAGGWLPREGGRYVVLPAGLAARCGTAIGGEVLLRFPRSDGGRSESVALPVKVAGVTEDGDGVRLPGRLVEDVRLWKAGLMEFNETSLDFESPVESSLRQGHVRANLYAAGPDEVAPLVRRLQAQGYHTEDRLAEQEGVRELGRVLVAVVVFFVSGCVLISAITVWLTTTLNLQSKTWEIGILRSLGVPARDVLAIFLIQGLLLGSAAFLGALMLFAAGQGLFRAKVAQVLAIKESAFLEGGPFEPSLLWLPGLVALVAIGFSVLGVLVPSLRACRLMPAEALRRRE